MRRIKSAAGLLMSLILLAGLTGCAADYGPIGPQWDGNVFFHNVVDHPYRHDSFRFADGGHSVHMRGFGGMGSRGLHTHGGAHAPIGTHRK
jgi:hypothetical protein